MNESVEVVVTEKPFTVRRTARWSDCDPAGVVYAGRYTEYLLGAVSHFMRRLRGGVGGPHAGISPEVDFPCKHMALTFHVSLHPEDIVEIQLNVGDIREHTFDVLARACLPDGRLAFDGVFTPICIQMSERRRLPIPAPLRQILQQHLIASESIT